MTEPKHGKPDPDETRVDLPVYTPPPPGYPPPGWYQPDLYRASQGYPPLPPPPSPQLPDFKPRSMSWIDKTLAWLMAFIVLVFGLVVAAHFLLKPATVKAPAHPTVSPSATHHPKAKATTSSLTSPSSCPSGM